MKVSISHWGKIEVRQGAVASVEAKRWALLTDAEQADWWELCSEADKAEVRRKIACLKS